MKKRLLNVFLALVIVLQLAFPSYFLFDAINRENKTYERGNEYTLRFDTVNFLGGIEGYSFHFQDNYTVENPDDYYDNYIGAYHYLAVAKGENGETLFFNAATLSKKQLDGMDVFSHPYKNIELNFEDYDFCGSIKSEEEFYNFLVAKAKEFYNEDENFDEYEFPSYEQFKSDEYSDNDYFYFLNATAEVDGSLKVKIYEGVLKITEIRFGEELILTLK